MTRDEFTSRMMSNLDGEKDAEIARLRKGIQDYLDGNYVSPRSFREQGAQVKCPHSHYYWEDCEGCIDAHFAALLSPADRGGTDV